MSDVRDPERDQRLPVPNDQPAVQDLVIADIDERMRHGIRKYGTALQAQNGRDMLKDAYEESLDLAVYLRGAIEERRLADPVLAVVAKRASELAEAFPNGPSSSRTLGTLRDEVDRLRLGCEQEGIVRTLLEIAAIAVVASRHPELLDPEAVPF